MEKEVGKVTHWYDKAGVAVLSLEGALKVGDKVKVKKGEAEFEETISSMQVDHKDVSSAQKGDEVAVKFSQKAREGAVIYQVE